MLRNSAPVVALHGFLGCRADWTGFDVDPIAIPPSLDDFDIAPGSILMGYSMGGRIALQLAAKDPGRYKGLILIGAHTGLQDKSERLIFEKRWLATFASTPYEQALKLWYNQPIFDRLRASSHFDSIFQRRLQKPSPWQYLSTYSLCKQPEIIPKSPTLFVYGEHDIKYTEIAKKFQHTLMIPGCGHAPHLENPKLFTDLLKDHHIAFAAAC